ncbi:27264_t:CDS:1, partial [Gigaspora margarita]
ELSLPLDSLLTETDSRPRSFRCNIQIYNSKLAFTSTRILDDSNDKRSTE